MLIKRQKEHAEKLRDKREKIEKRIELNVTMAEQIEEKRKNDFLDKQVRSIFSSCLFILL